MDIADSLAASLAPVVKQLGIDIDYVEITKAGGQRALEITLDGDSGVDIDTVATATRLISAWLDESNAMGEQHYILEVSSRGVGRPLTKPEHWRRNLGRLLTVTLDGESTTGRLLEFDAPTATLDTSAGQAHIDTTQVSRAVVEVEFNRKEDD